MQGYRLWFGTSNSFSGSATVAFRETLCCCTHFLTAGGSPWCCPARGHFAETAEFCTVRRHTGGADAAGRRRSWIRRSRPRGCLQGSRQVNAVPPPCMKLKRPEVKKENLMITVGTFFECGQQNVFHTFISVLDYMIYKMSNNPKILRVLS